MKRRWCDPFRFARMASVFNDTAHAVLPVVIGEIAYDPDTRMIHFHNGGDTFSRAQPQDRHLRRVRNGIAIERDDLKRVARQCQAANLRSASIQNVKKDAFPLSHTNRLTVT